MTLYPYVATLAVDPVTLVAAKGATGTIYAPEDTGFASPLTASDASGNPIPLTANADGILPSFYATEPAVNWRSGSYVFPLVTPQPLPGPQGTPGSAETPGANGTNGKDGSNVLPTATAINVELAKTFGAPTRTPPTAWPGFRTLTVPSIYRRGFGSYECGIVVDALRPAAGVTYYIAPDGVGANSGLTPALPTTLPTALGKADVGTIIFAEGEYFRNLHTPGVITNKAINFIAGVPDVRLTAWEKPSNLTWTLSSGNIYQTTRSATQLIADTRGLFYTPDGDYYVYTQKADLASIVGPGQWAIVGSVVYVWAIGNANLVTDSSFMRLSINTSSSCINANGSSNIYVQGLTLEGGGWANPGALAAFSSGAGTTGTPQLIAVDVVTKYTVGNAVTLTGAQYGIFIRCGVVESGADGFNYHSGTYNSATYVPDVIEVGCWSRKTGRATTVETQNGTTGHDGVRLIRVGGKHERSFGPVIADDSGAKSWNLGCQAFNSTALTRNYAISVTAADSEMWLEECTASDSKTGLYGDGTSKIHTKGSLTIRTATKTNATNSSVIDTYI